jgi:hypothetical protein
MTERLLDSPRFGKSLLRRLRITGAKVEAAQLVLGPRLTRTIADRAGGAKCGTQ